MKNAKYIFLALVATVAYCVWAAIAFFYDRTQVPEFLASVKYIATGAVAIIVRDMMPVKKSSDDATH